MLGLWACAQLPSRVQLFETPWTVARQTPLSMGFPRQESLDRVVISFSRRSSWPRDLTHVSSPCIGRQILYHRPTREAHARVISALQTVYQTSMSACLLLFSCSVMSDSLQPHGLQHTRLPVLHHLLELAQTHDHWVRDAIQPSHPLLSPSPPALNLPQHQGLSQWVGSSHQVAKVLELQLQYQSFQWIFRVVFL